MAKRKKTTKKDIDITEGFTPLQLAKKLNVQKTPDPTHCRAYKARTHGKRTGLGVFQFMATLFIMNEQQPTKEKMTDAEIKRQIQEEFPLQAVSKNLGPKDKRGSATVNMFRLRYNRGDLTGGTIPIEQSLRYDVDGKPVNARNGKPLNLTKAQATNLKQSMYEAKTDA